MTPKIHLSDYLGTDNRLVCFIVEPRNSHDKSQQQRFPIKHFGKSPFVVNVFQHLLNIDEAHIREEITVIAYNHDIID